ncbi:SAM-dependent methyltransferase, partial [Streptomyces carminius]
MTWNGEEYQARFDRIAAQGKDVHGEAALVRSFAPATVLDAGCGTGRVAAELARHGITVVGVDVDESMLATARRRAPEIRWHRRDLVGLDL